MKKIIIAIAAACAFAGCEKTVDSAEADEAWTNHGMSCVTKVVMIDGHKYILMDGCYSGTIIHAESCSCRK